AQPAAAAALALTNAHSINHSEISTIEVFSFHEACRLATREPADTEQAQYSLPFPVAAALVHGEVGPAQIDGDGLIDADVLRLSRDMVLSETEAYNNAFPQERFAHVKVTLRDGREFVSETYRADGDPETPLSDDVIVRKYHGLTDPVLGKARSGAIRETIEKLETFDDISVLVELLIPPA
ncbi:MAG: MmgE/PrpD family protein, partial [Pseudomonadota bacterium]